MTTFTSWFSEPPFTFTDSGGLTFANLGYGVAYLDGGGHFVSSPTIVSSSGQNVTNLNASSLASGTVPNARLLGQSNYLTGSFTGNGANLTNLPAAQLTGNLPAATVLSVSNSYVGSFTGNGSGLTNGEPTAFFGSQAIETFKSVGVTNVANTQGSWSNSIITLQSNSVTKVTIDGIGGNITNTAGIFTGSQVRWDGSSDFSQGFYLKGENTGLTAKSGTFALRVQNSTIIRASDSVTVNLNVAATADSTFTAVGVMKGQSSIIGSTTITATNGFVAIPSSGGTVALNAQSSYLVTSSTQTITLPSASTNEGKILFIKNGNVTATTLATVSSQTIDGNSTDTSLDAAYEGMILQAVGGAWYIMGNK